jgi:exodeoxyribonuclease VII small subunit
VNTSGVNPPHFLESPVTSKRPLDAAAINELSFEQAMERLEAIVSSIEQGQIGLEESVKQHELGVALIGRCKQILSQAEQKVEELNKGSAGSTKA